LFVFAHKISSLKENPNFKKVAKALDDQAIMSSWQRIDVCHYRRFYSHVLCQTVKRL